jgi:hypothetical protein
MIFKAARKKGIIFGVLSARSSPVSSPRNASNLAKAQETSTHEKWQQTVVKHLYPLAYKGKIKGWLGWRFSRLAFSFEKTSVRVSHAYRTMHFE